MAPEITTLVTEMTNHSSSNYETIQNDEQSEIHYHVGHNEMCNGLLPQPRRTALRQWGTAGNRCHPTKTKS